MNAPLRSAASPLAGAIRLAVLLLAWLLPLASALRSASRSGASRAG